MLQTLFVPFRDIHYVHPYASTNVRFVRKADAERAIEKMQGFPVGGSRIRLSWGRSQCSYLLIVPPIRMLTLTNIV